MYLGYGAYVNGLYVPVFDYLLMEFATFIAYHFQAVQLQLQSMHTASNINYTLELVKCIRHHKKLMK